ncbi:hypothetical protein IT575_08925 [bacterium]|nr:hypothetical protein [bacterium]
MLEQDVQLTRLIVEKLTELDQRKQQVSWQLSEAQERLDKVESLKNKRSAYEGVLERAAALLGRDDLVVEIDVPVDDSRLADELRGELGTINAEQAQYLELVDELRQRAPELLQAAAGMAPESLQALFYSAEGEAAQSTADEPSGSELEEEQSAEAEAESETELEPQYAAAVETVSVEDLTDDGPQADAEPEAEPEAAADDWAVPAFRPQLVEEDESEVLVDSEPAFEAATAELEADTYQPAQAAADSAEAEGESPVVWPSLDSRPESAASSASGAWDDEVEVVSSVNYAELEVEASPSNGHYGSANYGSLNYGNGQYSNGHYSNGSHVEDQEAETELSEEPVLSQSAEYAADDEPAEVQSAAFAEPSNWPFDAAGPEAEAEAEELSAFTHDASFDSAEPFAVVTNGSYASSYEVAPAFAADDEMEPAAQAAVAVHDQPVDSSLQSIFEKSEEDEEEARERLLRLARFDHNQLQRRIDSAQPAFVVDATAVLERIPHYDRYHLALDESAARDELVRDFSFLAADLNANVHLVFNDPHHAAFVTDERVHLEHGDVASGDQNPGDQRIQEIVLDYIEKEQPVALVTSDPTLQNLFKGENVLVFSLGEFFLT